VQTISGSAALTGWPGWAGSRVR